MSIPWIVQNGELDAIKEHVTAANLENYYNGRKAIHIAADYGHVNVIKFLLELGAEVNEADKYGITPLLAAVWEGHTEVVKLLVSKGANRDVSAPDGTALIDCTKDEGIRKILSS